MSQEIFFLKNGMAHECFILSRTVKTLYVRAAPVQRAGQASLLFCCPSLGGFPWWTEGHERWEDRSGRRLIKREQSGVQRTSLSQVKWDLKLGGKMSRDSQVFTGDDICLTFNCLLLPENSFVQRWRKTALVLTWDAKMMNGPIKKDEMQGDTFQWVGINQGWPGTGPHLLGAWHWQSWNSLCSLVIKVYGIGSSTTAGAGLKSVPHAIVFTLPIRGDRDSKRRMKVFLTTCTWDKLWSLD